MRFPFLKAYPGTNLHELDLDYVLRETDALSSLTAGLKDWAEKHEAEYEDLAEKVEGLINNLVDVIRPWDSSVEYPIYSIVEYQGQNYIAIQPVPVGAMITNTDYWQPANTVVEQINAIGTTLTEFLTGVPIVCVEEYRKSHPTLSDKELIQECLDKYYIVVFDGSTDYTIDISAPYDGLDMHEGRTIYGNGAKIKVADNNYAQYNTLQVRSYCRVEGLILEGDKLGHEYTSAGLTHEWCHGFCIGNKFIEQSSEIVKNVTLVNCEAFNFPGDSFNASGDYVTLDRCKAHNSRRQGLSSAGLNHSVICACSFYNIGSFDGIDGTAPMRGIDLETEDALHLGFNSLLIDGCDFHDNTSGALLIVNNYGVDVDVKISKCNFKTTGSAHINFTGTDINENNIIAIENSILDASSGDYMMTYADGYTVDIRDCVLRNIGAYFTQVRTNLHVNGLNVESGGNNNFALFRLIPNQSIDGLVLRNIYSAKTAKYFALLDDIVNKSTVDYSNDIIAIENIDLSPAEPTSGGATNYQHRYCVSVINKGTASFAIPAPSNVFKGCFIKIGSGANVDITGVKLPFFRSPANVGSFTHAVELEYIGNEYWNIKHQEGLITGPGMYLTDRSIQVGSIPNFNIINNVPYTNGSAIAVNTSDIAYKQVALT